MSNYYEFILPFMKSTEAYLSDNRKRIESLENYKNYQIDENRKVSRMLKQLEYESHQILDIQLSISKYASDVVSRIENLEKLSHSHTSNIESLCASAFNNKEKTKGLSFEEAIVAFKKGKKIRFNDGVCSYAIYEPKFDMAYGFEYSRIIQDFWEIV
jgi:hypothetical protein